MEPAIAGLQTQNYCRTLFTALIQGKAFCKDPEIGLSGDDIEQCQNYVANYIPKVMKHMFNGMGDHAEYICHHEWDLCHHSGQI